jgi:N-acetylglucosamine-6-phosphate deacetylase
MMSSFVLSGPTLLPDGNIADATLFIEHSAIAHVRPGRDSEADIVVTKGYVVPGFIELQINGAFGSDFTNGSAVPDVATRLPAMGVTAFLPTVITSRFEAYPKLLSAIHEASQNMSGARVLGVHLEGPYLSPRRHGAHNLAFLRAIDVDEIERWTKGCDVRIVTLAPELPGALDAVRMLCDKGIVVSAGHSDATFAQAMAGFEAGITWGTHLFNAMSELKHREPGLPGALLSSSVPCGLIADGIHVHPAAVKLAFRAKGADRLTLVTDAMEAMGMPPGRYKLADREVIVDSQAARLADGTLAGSILTMDQAVRNAIAFIGCSLAEAVTMASCTPARVLGLEHKGRIAPGCDADLIILDEAARVTHTFVAGHLVYEKPVE